MPFTVNDFHDLLAVLATHPEWRDELRRVVLTDDLASLPALVRDLAAAQQRTEQRLEELAAAQQRTEQRLEELAGHVSTLAVTEQRTEHRVDDMVGEIVQIRVERRAPSVFGMIGFRRVRVLDDAEKVDMADDALEAQRITPPERDELVRLDAVVRGRDRDGEVWLAVEVSSVGDAHDVDRAEARARVLGKVVGRTRPAVAANRFTRGAEARREANPDLVLAPVPRH